MIPGCRMLSIAKLAEDISVAGASSSIIARFTMAATQTQLQQNRHCESELHPMLPGGGGGPEVDVAHTTSLQHQLPFWRTQHLSCLWVLQKHLMLPGGGGCPVVDIWLAPHHCSISCRCREHSSFLWVLHAHLMLPGGGGCPEVDVARTTSSSVAPSLTSTRHSPGSLLTDRNQGVQGFVAPAWSVPPAGWLPLSLAGSLSADMAKASPQMACTRLPDRRNYNAGPSSACRRLCKTTDNHLRPDRPPHKGQHSHCLQQ